MAYHMFFSIPLVALIVGLLLFLLLLCVCGALLCSRGDPWEEEMGVDNASAVEQKSIIHSSSIISTMETGSRETWLSSLPPIDYDAVRGLERDPSGGVVLERMDRATAEALAVERVLLESQSSPLFNHLSLPLRQVRVIASRQDFL
ncbi:hypothetical protein PFISCL1PPCAC_15639 [Pristionchus fissidentatus]|uniref:Transmembrane protein n=1 Tax=Pristionchus fissidentatus TaxID=1538716 RepID=A0AAV5W2K1_9BILA|nr:hypothetical protein PFISCL1PPCAC_15639 [Pristionchus fissidentatus]